MKYNLIVWNPKTKVTTIFATLSYNHASALAKIFNLGTSYVAEFISTDKILKNILSDEQLENIQFIEPGE